MKLNIRKSTFETNSSSAHTCILSPETKEVDDLDIEIYKEGLFSNIRNTPLYISDDEFYIPIESEHYGRGLDILEDWYDRLKYLIADSFSDFSLIVKLADIVKKKIPGCKGLGFIDDEGYVINEALNLSNSNAPAYSTSKFQYALYDLLGSVDHQSSGTSRNCLAALKKLPDFSNKTDEELIYEFIFGNRILVIIDSDESAEFSSLISSGFVDTLKYSHILVEKSRYNNDGKKTWYSYTPEFIELDVYAEGNWDED